MLSTLDFRDDDLGVMLLFKNALTGVDNPSFAAPDLTLEERLLCVDLCDNGVVWCVASLGVIGDLTVRLAASAGTSGRPECAEMPFALS